MSHVLNVEISDETFRILEHRAKHVGDSPAMLVEKLLESFFSNIPAYSTEIKLEKSFESLFGSIDLGYPTGTDNMQIDKDLEKVYGE